MSPELTDASPEDLKRMLPLVRAYHEFEGIELDEASRCSGLLKLLGDPLLGRVWLIERDRKAIGYIALCFGFSIEYGGRDAFIDEFYLAPEFRDQGYGRAALETVVKKAQEWNIRALHLLVSTTNARAQGLYESSGFSARQNFQLMTRML